MGLDARHERVEVTRYFLSVLVISVTVVSKIVSMAVIPAVPVVGVPFLLPTRWRIFRGLDRRLESTQLR